MNIAGFILIVLVVIVGNAQYEKHFCDIDHSKMELDK